MKMVEVSFTIGDRSIDLEECRYVYVKNYYQYRYVGREN